MSRLCSCGSGLWTHDLVDAAGNYCRQVCDTCEGVVRARYRQAIFDLGSTYAATGEEADIDDGT